jgi:hypothetical protein
MYDMVKTANEKKQNGTASRRGSSPGIPPSSPADTGHDVEIPLRAPSQKTKGKGRETSVDRIIREDEEALQEAELREAAQVERVRQEEEDRESSRLEADRFAEACAQAARVEKVRLEEEMRERKRLQAEAAILNEEKKKKADKARQKLENAKKQAMLQKHSNKVPSPAALVKSSKISFEINSTKAASRTLNLQRKATPQPPAFDIKTLSTSKASNSLAQLLARDPQLSTVPQARGDIPRTGKLPCIPVEFRPLGALIHLTRQVLHLLIEI